MDIASMKAGQMGLPTEPYVRRRHWYEELQANWLEGVYTLAYSLPYVEAISWFDILDTHAYIDSGGLLRSPAGGKKAVYYRLERFKQLRRSLR